MQAIANYYPLHTGSSGLASELWDKAKALLSSHLLGLGGVEGAEYLLIAVH